MPFVREEDLPFFNGIAFRELVMSTIKVMRELEC
jgi:hypothetical protein